MIEGSKYLNSVAIRGNYQEGNFGDDALLLGCAGLLEGYTQSLLVEEPMAYRDERLNAVEIGQGADAVPDLFVYGGGTQFFSFDAGVPVSAVSRALGVARKLASPSAYVASIRARVRTAKTRRIPKMAIGVGLGPFSNRPSAEATAELLRDMALVWVRDARSEEFCLNYGIENVVASADLCFTDAFARVTSPTLGQPRADGQPLQVAIILRDWKFIDSGFFQRQILLARKLRSAGHQVRFLSLSPIDSSYAAEMTVSGESLLVWNARVSRIEDFWDLIAQQDLVITSRYHGAIFALLSETPFIAVEIEPKLHNLRDLVPELGQFAIDPLADIDRVYGNIVGALSQRDRLLPAMRNALVTQRDKARKGEEALSFFLESRMK